jgi:RNA polymerase sigma-70 factor (ECF subfamily)
MNLTDLTLRTEMADDPSFAGPLEEAFARHQDELLGTLYYLVGNLDDARDALQEAFLKCWRHREGVAKIENLKAWIFRVALNTGRDLRGAAWRRRRVPLVGEETMLATKQISPQAELENREQLARLRQAVGDLRAEEQEVFLLRQNGQMTYDEIAIAVGIPLGTVKTRMRLALNKLRVALAASP